MPKLAAPRGNSWGVPAYLFHPRAPPTYTHTHTVPTSQISLRTAIVMHTAHIPPPAHTCLNQTPISRWAHRPCVCKLIANLWQNFLNQSRAKTIYPTHPPTPPILVVPLALLSEAASLSVTSAGIPPLQKTRTRRNTPPVLVIRPEEDKRKGNIAINPWLQSSWILSCLPPRHLRMITPQKKQGVGKKKKRERKTNNEPPACCVAQIAPCFFTVIQNVAWK